MGIQVLVMGGFVIAFFLFITLCCFVFLLVEHIRVLVSRSSLGRLGHNFFERGGQFP